MPDPRMNNIVSLVKKLYRALDKHDPSFQSVAVAFTAAALHRTAQTQLGGFYWLLGKDHKRSLRTNARFGPLGKWDRA